ncbi:MAG TPA: class I SAM-dependent methyltransferase [Sphingomicrobium sp.]|jgi:SAM-dependent methyltransferase|nr:class I SAM-dependent methyltransferase [Sphingomicrobium sp.]
MAEAIEGLSEQFQPIPVRLDSSLRSTIAFAIRRFADLQLGTIWSFLGPRLSELRGNLLDVGCGEMPYRACLPPDLSYTGIDVAEADAFAMRASDAVVHFDGVSIPFSNASFDTILCTEVLEHAASPEALIAEIERVLKPGGMLLATVPFSARVHYAPYDFHRFTKFALKGMFASFRDVRIEERGNDIAVIANKLIVVALRMVRPSRWSIVHWPLLLLLVPFALAFLLAAHLTLALDLGSKDDPLGYSIVAVKRG